MKQTLLTFLLIFSAIESFGLNPALDDIRLALERASQYQTQEKVFVHTDNTCYFVGDTLWYKAYVVRADNLQHTDMSRLLYVELLSPDGLLVERQCVVVSDKGFSCGQFCLKDSLYSGYYELRAYTRWMLNFNVTPHRFSRDDGYLFYSKAMAYDYFRQWDGLYSRVLPIYSKPDEAGDYTYRRMYQRPKQNIVKPKKEELLAGFYPEGGSLIEGVPCRVAFELTDQLGEAVNVAGTVSDGERNVAEVRPQHMGRGSFIVTPGQQRLKATFTWHGHTYSFNLPKAERSGATMRLEGHQLAITTRGLNGAECGLSVLCRGRLHHFQAVAFDASGAAVVKLPQLPTGVNDVTLFTADGRIMADRLFFINNHDYDSLRIRIESGKKLNYEPYEQISLALRAEGADPDKPFSLSVRDSRTDEPSYDDGDIMTDLLLSSELRGFVARPAWYFERDDDERRTALDHLMMVQGWRKYKWQELSDTTFNHRRYTPEKTLTVEGNVYRMLSIPEVELTEIPHWLDGIYATGRKEMAFNNEEETTEETQSEESGLYSTDEITVETGQDADSPVEYGSFDDAYVMLGVNHGNLRHEVMVEAEIMKGKDVAGTVQKTKKGHFLFEIPPYYGEAILNLKAYRANDSVKKNMQSRKDATVFDETAFADYYVKRDMFYPVYTKKYDFYQNHQPEYEVPMITEDLSELSMENDNHLLQNVNVKGKRRGKRAIDYNKPAYVCDAYDLYNQITDYGLSYGKYDMRAFPRQVCYFLFGNMGRYQAFNIDARLNGHVFYRTYNTSSKYGSAALYEQSKWENRSPASIYNDILLKRLQDIRVFTDYEPRNEDSTMVFDRYSADATVELVPIPDDAKQVTYRDRHIILPGINAPEAFYQPDYSQQKPKEPTDYRRTLYWNPNAKFDEEGRFTATFYNNSKETRISISAAGVTGDGHFVR